ncbi:Pyruvate decarboxylase 1 [Elasticomyces elasticus]|nr:Pyruvate decarboxylase 1 [Elasticomyces elasticus]
MSQVKVGDYLFQRLAQLGIKTCWGVPGDYELALLDLIGDAGIDFRGNANELIASYAADGYSRINGAGAFVTTFGPGELSAYCGHAGAYAEYCPVVHVVGYPGVKAMENRTLMHHSLGTGDFDMYHEMVKKISVDTAVLTDLNTVASDIDRCLDTMLYESRPVYIGVPVDMSHQQISGEGLKTPLKRELPPNDKDEEDKVVDEIMSMIRSAKKPVM